MPTMADEERAEATGDGANAKADAGDQAGATGARALDENAAAADEAPRAELGNRGLEYQRYKAVAETFAGLDVLRMGVWPRPAVPVPGGDDASEIDMSEVSLFDLIDAFRTALKR